MTSLGRKSAKYPPISSKKCFTLSAFSVNPLVEKGANLQNWPNKRSDVPLIPNPQLIELRIGKDEVWSAEFALQK